MKGRLLESPWPLQRRHRAETPDPSQIGLAVGRARYRPIVRPAGGSDRVCLPVLFQNARPPMRSLIIGLLSRGSLDHIR